MQVRQNSTDHAQVQQTSTAGAFTAFTLPQLATFRTLALLATILLVAFALYMTRPGAEATGEKGASIHMTSATTPASHEEAQPQAQDNASQSADSKSSNTSRVHNEITVNGKSISVPDNGSLHKTITEGDTTTTVDVSNNSSTTVSSSNVSVQSSSGSTDSQEP